MATHDEFAEDLKWYSQVRLRDLLQLNAVQTRDCATLISAFSEIVERTSVAPPSTAQSILSVSLKETRDLLGNYRSSSSQTSSQVVLSSSEDEVDPITPSNELESFLASTLRSVQNFQRTQSTQEIDLVLSPVISALQKAIDQTTPKGSASRPIISVSTPPSAVAPPSVVEPSSSSPPLPRLDTPAEKTNHLKEMGGMLVRVPRSMTHHEIAASFAQESVSSTDAKKSARAATTPVPMSSALAKDDPRTERKLHEIESTFGTVGFKDEENADVKRSFIFEGPLRLRGHNTPFYGYLFSDHLMLFKAEAAIRHVPGKNVRSATSQGFQTVTIFKITSQTTLQLHQQQDFRLGVHTPGQTTCWIECQGATATQSWKTSLQRVIHGDFSESADSPVDPVLSGILPPATAVRVDGFISSNSVTAPSSSASVSSSSSSSKEGTSIVQHAAASGAVGFLQVSADDEESLSPVPFGLSDSDTYASDEGEPSNSAEWSDLLQSLRAAAQAHTLTQAGTLELLQVRFGRKIMKHVRLARSAYEGVVFIRAARKRNWLQRYAILVNGILLFLKGKRERKVRLAIYLGDHPTISYELLDPTIICPGFPWSVEAAVGVYTMYCATEMQREHWRDAIVNAQLFTVTKKEKLDKSKTKSGDASTTPTSIPTSAELVGLVNLLKDPAGYASFMKFLESEHSSENLLFYSKVLSFQQCAPSERTLTAHEIYEQFLAPTATHPVNVGDIRRREVIDVLRDPARCDHLEADLFDQLQLEALVTLRDDSYKRYRLTEAYTALKRSKFTNRPSGSSNNNN